MDYKPQEPNAAPEEFEILVEDPTKDPVPEVETYIQGIAELNAQKCKTIGKNIYRLSEQVRDHKVVGKYTSLVVSEFDGSGASRPVQIITFVDQATGLPLANQNCPDLRKATNTLRSKGLAAFARKRGQELVAARTTKLKVKFTPQEDDEMKRYADLKKRLEGKA